MSTVNNIPSYSLYINGEWQKGTGGEHVRYSPAHGEPVAKYEKASQEDAQRAVAAARQAFDSGIWSGLDGADRAAVLLKFADLLMKNQQRLGQLESATHGTPLKYGLSFIKSAANTFRYFAGLARDLHGHAHGFGDNRMGMTLQEPVGSYN